MDIPSAHVYQTLVDKGVTELHHANSVATACQFLKHRALMSRGNVERLGLTQSRQASDDLDRRYSIWFDVFLDSVDIHDRARRANVYGPVLFVFDLKLIDANQTGRIWVTKRNPTKWADRPAKERWFQGKDDLEENFVRGEFDQMLLLRHCGGAMPFGGYLKKIILDEPALDWSEGKTDVHSVAVGALRLAMQDAKIHVPVERRSCRIGCACKEYWGANDDRLQMMFDPIPEN